MFFHSTSPPNGWTLSRLKDVARLNPEVLPETTDPDLEIQYVDIGNVSSDGQVLDTEVLAFADAPSRARRSSGPAIRLSRPCGLICALSPTWLSRPRTSSYRPDSQFFGHCLSFTHRT
jgi:hypothetical protein